MAFVDGAVAAYTSAAEMKQDTAVVFVASEEPQMRRMDEQLDKVEEDDELLALSAQESP